jgi:hypothetical protein
MWVCGYAEMLGTGKESVGVCGFVCADWEAGGGHVKACVVNTGYERPICSGAESDDFSVLFIINGRSIAARGLAGDHGGAAQGSEGTGGKIGSHGTYGFF